MTAEIGTRLNLLLLYGLSHLADKQPALDLEKEIRSFLRARAPFDISAEDALYTLDRSAGGLHNAEMTLRRNRVSAEYFGRGDDESLLRRPLEYYRCLVNLGSSLICNGRFGEAVETFREVEDLIGDYVGGVFPRTDYASMNLLLAEYRDGSVAPEAAVRRQATIVDELSAESDPFYGENALAVYLALSGENEEAISRFDRLDENLVRTRTDPEPSMAYLIRSNRCAARFVAGQRDGLSQEWAELTELVARNAYPSRLIYMRRHELMAEVLEEDQPSSAIEFDQVLIARHPHEFGPLWKNFGRGFTMPAIEFWREN